MADTRPKLKTAPAVHLDHLDALLDGYESSARSLQKEAAALAPMTVSAHAEFALSEADYFLGVLHSEEKAVAASMAGSLVMRAGLTQTAASAFLIRSVNAQQNMRESFP